MRKFYLFIAALVIFIQTALAQCPPPGFPNSGNTCPEAPILCENLDGYCNTINNNNQQQSFPGCGNNWVLNNDEWFAFYAGTTTITIVVTPTNCSSNGNNVGLQGGIYHGCGGAVMDVQCSCTDDPFTLTSNNYVVGEIYWFVLDGCAGDVCDYSIDVTVGSTVGAPPEDPEPITGPDPVCAGTSQSYSVPDVTGATIFTWTLTPSGMGTMSGGNDESVNVAWNANANGEAQLCLAVANACYPNPDTVCKTITVIPKPNGTLSGGGVICGNSGGTVNLTVTFTGVGPWVFTPTLNGAPQTPITTSDNPYTLVVNQPGTWGITNVHPQGLNCNGTASGTAVVTQVNVTHSATSVAATCGQSNGSIDLTVGGGNAPYTYNWSNGASTQDQSNVAGGTYDVTITDNNGCTATHTVTVADNMTNISLSATTTANTVCNSNNNGAINLSVSPSGTYTFNWSNGATTEDLNNLAPGTYDVTVTTGLTCTATGSYTVADQPNEPNATYTTVQSTCDLPNGSINLSVTGGVTPYTFIWSNGATTEDLSNILAGAYDVTVTGANGCTDVANITVSNNNPPINLSSTVVANTNCNGVGNGSINLSVSPNGTYTFNWSNGATTEDINNLLPGSYQVTVTGQGTCSSTADITVPDNPLTPSITYSTVQSTCDLANGSINVTVNGGVTPYTYLWSNGAVTQDLSNILAGDYSVTVTGANGCTDDANINVGNNNPPITVSGTTVPNTTCNGTFNGSINVTTAPSATYTFLWSTGATTEDINSLAAGTYTITVTGQGTCSQTAEFTVQENANVPHLVPTVVNTTCDLPNGSINLGVTGSVPPYTFNWSNGSTNQNQGGLLAGSYDVTVTGSNGCSTVETIDVNNFNPPINLSASIVHNTTCQPTGNGAINLTITPPGSYTIGWSNGSSSEDLTNLLPGDYTVTVSAGGTCVEIATFTVDDNPNEPVLSFTQVDARCGLSNGSINLSVSGGVSPFTYLWSNGATTQDLNNIPADIYSVTVTGANACTSVEGVVIDNNMIPVTIDAVVKGKTSCITNNGSIMLNVTPANVTVSWDNGSSALTRSNLAPGTYSVTVSAGGTCTETATFEIYDETEFPALSADITPGYCSLPTGAIDLTVDGGAAPYTYKWSNNATWQDLINLTQNTYTVTVTTSLGCTAETSVFVPNNDIPIVINGTVYDNVSCVPPLNGAIDLDIDPTGYTYKFTWSNGSQAQNLANLSPGTYTVTVKLGSTCSATETFQVQNAAVSPNLSVSSIPAICGLSNGGANLTVTGASSPYSYHWSNNSSAEDLANVLPGNYSVTVTDFFGCTATTAVTVSNNNVALNLSGAITDNTSCAVANGAVNLTVSPAGPYNYTWSNSAATEDISALAANTYTVTVTAGASCSSTATFIVPNNTSDPVIAPAVTAAICTNPNGAINLTVTGAQTPYTFAWSNAAVTEDLSGILPGTYTVTVTGANGCKKDTILFVPNNSSTFSLTGATQALTNCATPNGSIDLTVTPAGPYTYQWSNTALTQDVSNLPAGIYTVSVTETGTCTASISFIIPDDRTYPLTNQTIQPELCNLQNGQIDLEVTGGVTPYTFSWNNSQSTEDLVNISDGQYAVTVTGANNCTATAAATVPDNSVTFSLSAAPTDNTSCAANNGTVDLTVSPATPGSGLNYTYQWSNSLGTQQDLSGMGAGTYTVTVSAGGTCTSTANYTILNDTQAPVIAEAVTAAFCGQNSGSVDLSISGGQAPFVFHWSTQASTEDLTNIPSGSYDVTVTGANGCSSTDNYVIPENITIPSINGVVIGNTSCVSQNGAITLSVSPTLTYTYVWGGGQVTPNLQNISGGNYSVTVSAGGGCTAEASFNVPSDVEVVTLGGSTTDILCFSNSTGAINLTVNGGTAPLTYKWTNTTNNVEDQTNLPAGTYTVTVTDINGCSSSTTFNLTQPAAGLQIACSHVSDISSPTATDGKGAVDIQGGTPPYTVAWTPGSVQANVIPGVFSIDNLSQGNFQVAVTDDNGCPAQCDFNIGLVPCTTGVGTMGNASISLCGDGCITANYNALGQFLDPNDALQFILHEGSGAQIVNEIARSAQPKFCFDPNTMTYGTTYYISAVAGNADPLGNVNLAAYCTVISAPTPIVFYEKPEAAINPPMSLNCVQREVNLIGSSTLPGSIFLWYTTNGQFSGSVNQSNTKVTKAGDYFLTVNANGCKDTTNIAVLDISNNPKAIIEATPDDLLDCKINEITLSGSAENTFDANTIWISNGTVYTPGTVLKIEDPGAYQFVILDTLTKCTDTALIVINQDLAYPPLFVNPPGQLTCAHPSVTLSGGSPFQGIQFNWATISGADTTIIGSGTSFAVTAPGTYWLLAVDPVNQCKNDTSVTVTANQVLPVADAGDPFSIKCYGETANLDGTGSNSTGLLQYLWTTQNGNILSGNNTASPLIGKPGTYVLLVTDPANGCTDSDDVLIQPIDPTAKALVNHPPCYGDKGSIIIEEVIGGKPPIQFTLNNGQPTTNGTFINLNPGPYTITVQDAEGCSTTLSKELIEPAEFIVTIEPEVTIKLGEVYHINAEINLPLNQVQSVKWTPANGLSCDTCLTLDATPWLSTVYKVVVRTKNGCHDDAQLRLLVDRRVDVYIPNVFSPNDDGENDKFTVYADIKGVSKIHLLQVYSRWGELLWERRDFQPNEEKDGWDGTYKGQDMNPGVFVYQAIIEFIDGREELFKGDVTIER